MTVRRSCRVCLIAFGWSVIAFAPARAQSTAGATKATALPTRVARNGQADFDFHIGTWKTHLTRRLRPLTGSTEWAAYDQEPFNGRAILVRFVISDITPTSVRFEQSYSDDGGKTWELNWIAVDTRVPGTKP